MSTPRLVGAPLRCMDLEPEGIVPPDADVVVGNDPAVLEIERLLEQGLLLSLIHI